MMLMRKTLVRSAIAVLLSASLWALWAFEGARPEYAVQQTEDFAISGDGSDPAWAAAAWESLARRGEGLGYDARFKALYSKTGIYFLMRGTDAHVTATKTEDFLDLWNEDVFEVFLWPDERYPVYFEYEISPLGKELPIIIPNFGGKFFGWRPWQYSGEREVRRKVTATGGPLLPGAKIASWTAEFFIPYALLDPLQNVPPGKGTRWRANLYRVDHDGGERTAWDWSRVGPSFHEYEGFGTLTFR